MDRLMYGEHLGSIHTKYQIGNKPDPNTWARAMASSSVTTPPIATSRAIGGNRDFVNHSTNNWSGMVALINHHHRLHSCI
jgi:hypothetical protein